jgi:Pyruvate/2-oxoacid:ferredoxin oxidoreductase gamma subunit
MSQEALDKNIADLKGNGLLLIDNLLVKNVPKVNAKIYAAPATQIAEDVFKNRLYANMVILGVLNTLVNLVRNESMEDAIRDAVTSGAVIINLEAYKKGRNLAASYRTI